MTETTTPEHKGDIKSRLAAHRAAKANPTLHDELRADLARFAPPVPATSPPLPGADPHLLLRQQPVPNEINGLAPHTNGLGAKTVAAIQQGTYEEQGSTSNVWLPQFLATEPASAAGGAGRPNTSKGRRAAALDRRRQVGDEPGRKQGADLAAVRRAARQLTAEEMRPLLAPLPDLAALSYLEVRYWPDTGMAKFWFSTSHPLAFSREECPCRWVPFYATTNDFKRRMKQAGTYSPEMDARLSALRKGNKGRAKAGRPLAALGQQMHYGAFNRRNIGFARDNQFAAIDWQRDPDHQGWHPVFYLIAGKQSHVLELPAVAKLDDKSPGFIGYWYGPQFRQAKLNET